MGVAATPGVIITDLERDVTSCDHWAISILLDITSDGEIKVRAGECPSDLTFATIARVSQLAFVVSHATFVST